MVGGTKKLLKNVNTEADFLSMRSGNLTVAKVGDPWGTSVINQIGNLTSNMPSPNTLGVTTDPTQLPVTLVGAYFQSNPGAWNHMVYGANFTLSNGTTITSNDTNTWLKQVQAAPSAYLGGANATVYFNKTLDGKALSHTEKRFQFFILPTILNTAAGMVNYGADLAIKLSGLENLKISNSKNIMGGGDIFPTNSPSATGRILKVSNWGGGRPYINPLCTIFMVGSNTRVDDAFAAPWKLAASGARPPYYSLISMPFTIDTAGASGSALVFSGGSIDFSLYQGLNAYDDKSSGLDSKYIESSAPKLSDLVADSKNLIQAATIEFPAATFPLPILPAPSATSSNGTIASLGNYNFMEDRLSYGNEGPAGSPVFNNSYDLIRSMVIKGDGRIAAVTGNISKASFVPSAGYSSSTSRNQGEAGNLPLVRYKMYGSASSSNIVGYISSNTTASSGDFDLPSARCAVGAYINKPDEGDYSTGCYYYWSPTSSNALQYTPNRIMPSSGMFGSLPTGAIAQKDWQTLLFRPQSSHPSNSSSIPDHLIMDLFWMPIVEPYAISENFSTAGKTNMNYQILPFTYINRSTALLASMKTEMVSAVPNNADLNSDAGALTNYTPNYNWTGASGYRKTLNFSETNGTLRQFREKFAAGQIFRSASEICDIYLTPRDQIWTSDTAAQTFWNSNLNTPDNLREKPYANLYARLTTKSNTFTIHVRAQALQKVPGTPADQWVEGRDKVVGEERISTVVERYLDENVPDFATNTNALLSDSYRMRVLSTKRFAP
jgi:hypothetical protein